MEGGDAVAQGAGPVGDLEGLAVVDVVGPHGDGCLAGGDHDAVGGDDEGSLVQALPQQVRGRPAVDGLVSQSHPGLRLRAEHERCAGVGALADQLGQVLVRGVLRAFPEGHVDRAPLVVDLAHRHEVPGRGLGPAVGALLAVDDRAHERELRLVHDPDERRELRSGRCLEAALHLRDQALHHLGGLDDVVVGRALDEDGGQAVEHAPVPDALEVCDPELHGAVQGQPQGQGSECCGLALVGQAGDEQVALVEAQGGCVAAQVLAPRCLAALVVGLAVGVGDQWGRADRLVQCATVRDPEPDRAGRLGDRDEHFVLMAGQVLSELAPPLLHLVRGDARRQSHVDFNAASGDPDRTQHARAGVAHVLDGVAQRSDPEVAQREDDDGRGDRLPFTGADVGGQGPLGCCLLVLADGPQSEQDAPRADGDQRSPGHCDDEDDPADQLDQRHGRGADVGPVLVRDGEHDAEEQETTRPDAEPGRDALGRVHGGGEQVHAAAVAFLAEALPALFPLGGGLHVPRGFRRAQETFVAGGGAALPGTAGHDPRPAEDVEAVAGGGAAGGLGGLVGGHRADAACGAHPQGHRRLFSGRSCYSSRVGRNRRHGGGGGLFEEWNDVLGHVDVSRQLPRQRGR